MNRWTFVALSIAVFILLIAGPTLMSDETASPRAVARYAAGERSPGASERETALIAAGVAEIWRDGQLPEAAIPLLDHENVKVYVALRKNGRKLSEFWSKQHSGLGALTAALKNARARLKDSHQPDTVELVIAHSFEPVLYDERNTAFTNLQLGISGIELQYGTEVETHAPTQMIASNRSFAKIIDRFAEAHSLNEPELAEGLTLRRFSAEQFLVSLGAEPSAIRLFRGNSLVEGREVTREAVAGLARRMADWMVRGVREDGRMIYKYWPSNGRESSSNNMIRQWMATVCLIRLARFYDDPAIATLAERNIRYNLRQFYRETGDFGFIEFQDKAKLGAAALAALALAEHPNSEAFEDYEAALRRSIRHLWSADGSFRTFLKPADRNDNQNFYPGEALVYLATFYSKTSDERILQRLLQSFRYYRSWHLAQRNPAFVPWHTMAYAQIWGETADPSLQDWIFEMNDWLLDMQQQAPAAYPDVEGRFYDPGRRHFGPPHASSTGVYLEGLIQAYRVARGSGDPERAETYRIAILRGLRSLMQLEFADEVDMFYVSKRESVHGGLRTTVYDNEIRVDNVQHSLMAVLEILSTFRDTDFARSGLMARPSDS